MILVAVVWSFYRRYVEKIVRLKRGFKAGLVLVFIGALMLSVILANGMDMIWNNEPYAWWTPLASATAFIFGWLTPNAAEVGFYIFWWSHLLIILSFAIYVPQSKHAHLLFAPANVFFGPDT